MKIIDALLRRELLRGAWLDLTHVDSRYGMCAMEHLEQVLEKAPAEQESGAELIRSMFKKNSSIYDNGAAAVRPVGTALLQHPQSTIVPTGKEKVDWLALAEVCFIASYYYTDMFLDILVMSSYLRPVSETNPAGDHLPLFLMSLAGIVISVGVNIAYDDVDETHKGLTTHLKPKDEAQQKWWFKTWPWFKKCLRNILHLRMLAEARKSVKCVTSGYKPASSVKWIRVSEGLFEAAPQSALQTYVIAKLIFGGTSPTTVQVLSAITSSAGIGTAVVAAATIGSNSTPKENSNRYRVAFTLFAITQSLLRIWTLCGFLLAIKSVEYGATARSVSGNTILYMLLSMAVCFVSAGCMVCRARPT